MRSHSALHVDVGYVLSSAVTLSDRTVVLKDGRIEQAGTPEDSYEEPQTRFVAGFIGESNVLDATVDKDSIDVDDIGVVPGLEPTWRGPCGGRVHPAARADPARAGTAG